MTVFNLIKDPLRLLPMVVGMAIQFTVSMNRIQKFINNDEVVLSQIEEVDSQTTNNSVEINTGNFFWGFPEKKKDEKKADEEKKEAIVEETKEVSDDKIEDSKTVKAEDKAKQISDLLVLRNINLEIP